MNPIATKNLVDKPFSEVVFSTSDKIIAQCYKEAITNETYRECLIQGNIVKIISSYDSSYQAFGIIAQINNTSLDSIHKPQALGLSQEELSKLHPQIYELLRKELEIYLFSYLEKEAQIINYPPPKPMMIHDFVYLTSQDELLELTKDLSSLINIIKKHKLPIDILINLISKGYIQRNKDRNYLIKISQNLSFAFQEDVENLMNLLKRLGELEKD